MSQDEQLLTTEPKPSRRRRFRFRMRSLLALTTLLAVILGWVATERRQSAFERRIGNELRQQKPTGSITFLGPYDSLDLADKNEPQGWWRDLARKVLGVRIFRVSYTRDQDSLNLLVGVKSLESLTLSGKSRPISDLAALSNHKHLKELKILDAWVDDLSPLSGLTSLESISLTRTPVSDLTALGGLNNLKSLQLANVPIRDLTPLNGLKNLEELRLINTPDTDLTPLIGLANLQVLQVPGSSVSDPNPLAELKNLRQLYFTGSSFVGELFQLSGPDSLQRLWQSHPCISDEDFKYLQKALPNCRVRRSGRRPQS